MPSDKENFLYFSLVKDKSFSIYPSTEKSHIYTPGIRSI